MGRWSYSSRWTVEECKSIATKFLNRDHFLDGGLRSGELTWSRNGEKIGSAGCTVSVLSGDEYVRLQYTYTNRNTGEKADIDYKVRLVSTPCQYGGRRWWFICPLISNGSACGRRVGVLYAGGGKYFGCRHCYNLTYESCKESHKFDSLFRRLGITQRMAKAMFKHGI